MCLFRGNVLLHSVFEACHAAAVPGSSHRQERAPKPLAKGHRGDIQGLRAVLMAQVLLFHAWDVGSPIGVDAFIMVSAYLMTSSFVRRSENGKMPFFIERWGNTFKRLLPPLVVVVLATLVASLFVLPMGRWRETVIQSFASLTYWENWRLVEVAADYYADDSALSSPLQHLWSMSMQGQIFLLWPLLMTLCVLAARRMKVNLRSVVVWAFGVLALVSLGWLLWFAPADGSVYFDTRARIWEFAFGSMIAAAAPWLKVRCRAAGLLVSGAFLVLVLYCLVSIGTYPGPMAIVPMACVSAILLWAPQVKGHWVPTLLGSKPLVELGDTSYTVYLVHWPVFVLYLVAVGRPQLGFIEGIVLIVISIVVASLLTKYVDDPLRLLPWANSSTPHKYVVVALNLVIGLIPVLGVYVWLEGQSSRAAAELEASPPDSALLTAIPESGPGSDSYPGARVMLSDFEGAYEDDPIPGPLAPHEYARFPDGHACSQWIADNIERNKNSFCDAVGDPELSAKHALIVGNSHAQQLLVPQIMPILQAENWSAEAILRGACSFGDPSAYEEPCDEHNQKIFTYIEASAPDYVFLIATRSAKDSPEETLIEGVVEAAQWLTDRGITVIALTDNLRSEDNLLECLDDSEPGGHCVLEESQYFGPRDLTEPLAEIEGVHVIDMRDAYCTDGKCPTLIGNIYVYLDTNHVTTTYSQTVAPFFSQRVAAALGLA